MPYVRGTIVIVDLDSYFYRDSDGNGRGWPISKVYNDESEHFTINHVNPGHECPYHIHGKYGDLGWVRPSAIIRVAAAW